MIDLSVLLVVGIIISLVALATLTSGFVFKLLFFGFFVVVFAYDYGKSFFSRKGKE